MTVANNAVFLSYASEDTEAASRISEALRASGIEVWFDQSELRGGDAWDRNIRKQIHDCALFIAVVSAHSNARGEGYFRREWRLAVERTHDKADDEAFLVPVVIDDTSETTARVPDAFREIQWTKLPGGAAPPAFAQHVARLLASLDSAGASVSAPRALAATSGRVGTAALPLTGSVARRRSPALKWMGVAVAVAALIAIAGLLMQRQSAPGPQAAATHATVPAAAAAPTIPLKSVAVLPFTDMSEKHDQEFLADGMAEEIIERLIKVPELRVPARASSFYFKGKDVKLADIGRELSVANILEGTVRKSGSHLRINAQLVRADNGLPVWSETFDRQFADVFKIQDEIATAAATALQITLSGGPLTREEGGTRNLEAYQLYLRGTSALNENSAASVKVARASFEQAIGLDPNYGLAWSGLAFAWTEFTDQGNVPPEEGYKRTRQAALRAIELSPRLGLPHGQLAYVYRTLDWNWAAAAEEVDRALAINPSDVDTMYVKGLIAQTLGRRDEADRWLRAAVATDPLSTFAIFNYGNALYLAGRLADAEAQFRRLIQVAPQYEWTRAWLAKTLVAEGQPAAALVVLPAEGATDSDLTYLAVVLLANGRKTEAAQAMERLEREQGNVAAFYVASYYAYANDRARALQWLERAVEQKDVGLVDILGEPLLRNIENEPRYKAVLRRMNLPGG